MSETITIDEEEYELSNNPSLRTVRHVQNMQMDMIMNHVDEEDLRNMDSMEDESEIIDSILDSGGMQALQDVMWERSMLENAQTISLACDEVIDTSDLEEVGAQDYKAMKNKAEDVLDGNAADFFEELNVGSFLNKEQMQQRATEAQAQNAT